MEALKHYYGITHTNELIVRGIEARRHDAPNFIKDFQSELLYTLFDCKDSAEVVSKGYENALLLVTKTIDKVMTGELVLKDLVVSKILRQDLYKYRSLFPHVSAAFNHHLEINQLYTTNKKRCYGLFGIQTYGCGYLYDSSTGMPVRLSENDSLNYICHAILLTIYFSSIPK